MKTLSRLNKSIITIIKSICPIIDVLFCVGYFLITTASLIGPIPFIGENTTFINIAGVILLFFTTTCWVLLEQNPKKSILFLALITLSAISYYHGKTTVPLKLGILLFAIPHFSFKRYIKLDFLIRLTIFTVIILCFAIGITTDGEIITRSNGAIRYGFGFSHPNTFAIVSSILIMELYYLDYKSKQFKWPNLILTIIVCLINFFFVDSRSALFLVIASTIVYLIPEKWLKLTAQNKTIRHFLCNIFIIYSIAMAILVIGFTFKWKFGYRVNELLSGRTYLYNLYLTNVDIGLFGIDISRALETTPLDGIYMSILVRYGIILFTVYAAMTKRAINNLLEHKKLFVTFILVLTLTYGAVESVAISPVYNPFIVLLCYGIAQSNIPLNNPTRQRTRQSYRQKKRITRHHDNA